MTKTDWKHWRTQIFDTRRIKWSLFDWLSTKRDIYVKL